MIFPNVIYDSILQINDKQRFNASKTFITPNELSITKLEFSFDDGVTYIDVYKENYEKKWFIDYAYDSVGIKVVKLKVTTELGTIEEKDFSLEIITEESDRLFSTDEKMIALESELIELMPKGRNSFKYAHRKAQEKILRYLDGSGIRKSKSEPFTKEELFENVYIQEWALYQVLVLVFEDLTVRVGDQFKEKVKTYNTDLTDAIKNAPLRLDYNQDGEVETTEIKTVQNKFLSR